MLFSCRILAVVLDVTVDGSVCNTAIFFGVWARRVMVKMTDRQSNSRLGKGLLILRLFLVVRRQRFCQDVIGVLP